MSHYGKIHHISNINSFNQILELQNEKGFTLILCFSAKWCGPCKVLSPKLEEYAIKYPSAIFLKIDIDLCESIASDYNVTSVPTIIIERINSQRKTIVGASIKEIEIELQK